MAKLRVRRKAYKRKPYTQKGGVRVEGTKVPATTFSIKDRGKPGRTPEEERFYYPKVTMNWHKTQGATVRRRNALKAHSGNYLATARALIALHNVTTDTETKQKAYADAHYFFALHNKSRK
jgi:hypothetical protein